MKEMQGKILRVKEGYNPNSSSVGSVVFAVPAAILAAPVVFGAVSAVILSKTIRNPSAEEDHSEPDVEAEK